MDALQRVLRASGPAFVSMIWANNETGVVSPAGAIAEICRANGALLHLDAVQAPMHIDVDAGAAACDYLSLSAHKFHGPKGVGILAAKSLAPRAPLLPGHQESGMRGGTENLPAIVGAAAALALQPDWRREAARQARLRDALERGILETIPGTAVNGAPTQRIGNTTSIFFPGRNAADMVAALGRAGLCVSAGAACSTGGRPSHVLQAMGYGEQRANGSIRFSLGRENTEAEVARALEIVRTVYASGLVAWGEQ
jgi:cysteine desulfurase